MTTTLDWTCWICGAKHPATDAGVFSSAERGEMVCCGCEGRLRELVPVIKFRPKGFGPWLIFDLANLDGLIDELRMGVDQCDPLELEYDTMTRLELHALPEHPGW